MYWKENIKIIYRGEEVLLIRDSKWLIVPKETYEIFDSVFSKGLSIEDILKEYDEESQVYLKGIWDKLRELGIFEKESDSYTFYVNTTNRCNLSCRHCSINAKNIKHTENKDLSTEELKKALKKVIECNPTSIILTGGEPMVRMDLQEILIFIRSNYSGKISLMTNGTLINNSNVKWVAELVDNIDISIDGVDEESCSKFRGKGVFSKVLDSVFLLKKIGFSKISLSMVFGTYNSYLYDDFIKLNNRLNTFPIPRIFTPLGRGEKNKKEFIKENKNESLSANFFQKIEDISISTCGVIDSTLCIGNDGSIFPCSLLIKDKYVMGNIQDIDDLNEWLENTCYTTTKGYHNLIKLFPENIKKCSNCTVKDFCWGCLEVIDRFSQDDSKFEKRCKLIKGSLENCVWNQKENDLC